MTDQTWTVRGEVVDREDLLDGRVRVELAGTAGSATIEAGFAWRRGRNAVPLDAADCYLTIMDGESELHAGALGGSVSEEPDTGAVRVTAQFIIEDSVGLGATDMPVAATLTVTPEDWTGEFMLGMRLRSVPPGGVPEMGD